MRGEGGGTNPFRHFALRNATSPEGGGLGKEGRSRPHPSTAGRRQPISGKLFAPAKASPFRERWHGEAVTERVAFGTNPLSRLRRQLSRRESPWQRGQVSSSPVNGRRSQPISGKLFASAKASPFRERWHGEAVTERVVSKLPLAVCSRKQLRTPCKHKKARRRVLQRAFDGSCGVAALSAAQQCLTPARPGPGWWNARSPSLPHGGCPRYGAWPPGSNLP